MATMNASSVATAASTAKHVQTVQDWQNLLAASVAPLACDFFGNIQSVPKA